MKLQICIITLTLIIMGCGSSTLVTPSGEKGDLSYPQFNENFGNDEADIYLRDGQKLSGKSIYISHDTVSWSDPDNRKRSAPVENVRNVVTVNHTSSALLGLGMGAAVGVGISLATTAGPHSDGAVGIVWVIAPPGGALIGAGLGALIGWHSRYEFPTDTTSTHSGNNK